MVSVSPLTSNRSYRTVRQTQETLAKLLALLEAGEDRQVRRAPLPGSPAIPARLRATEQGQQVDRARGSLKLSDRAGPGVPRRLSSVGVLAADSRINKGARRAEQGGPQFSLANKESENG
jgi:hypothetical protein